MSGSRATWIAAVTTSLALALLLAAGWCVAATPPKILLVVDGQPGALARRLRAELDGLGFESKPNRGSERCWSAAHWPSRPRQRFG